MQIYIHIYIYTYILATSTVDKFVTTISYFSRILQYLQYIIVPGNGCPGCRQMWATGFINCLIYFTILAMFFVQFYGLFHDSAIGSTQFPKYPSILPLIFSSCPTYFMSVPVLSFNFQANSMKMYQSDTYIHT